MKEFREQAGAAVKVCVFGAGYVGLVTTACLADLGNSLICVDIDTERIKSLRSAGIPIHEPGLEEMVARNVAAGRIEFTTDAELAVSHGTVIFIAVGTPSAEDGSAMLGHVLAAASTIGRYMRDHKVIVNKSTVPVGTTDRVRESVATELHRRSANVPFAVVSNPEFLREGIAIEDFMRPDRVIVGCNDDQALLQMRQIYAPVLRHSDRMLVMDARSAELTKYVANAMLASRISFMNEMAAIAERVGADIERVRLGIASDRRIGKHFLHAGCGWGGSCLPKDVQALRHIAAAAGVEVCMLDAAVRANDRQRRLLCQRVVERFGESLAGHTFGVWGLAFKPGTDDLREAPSLLIIADLLRRGARVQAFDPMAMPAAAGLWPGRPGLELVGNATAAAAGASALLVVTEWPEFGSHDLHQLRATMKHPIILDGRNIYDPIVMRQMGFEYVGVGRGVQRLDSLPASPYQSTEEI